MRRFSFIFLLRGPARCRTAAHACHRISRYLIAPDAPLCHASTFSAAPSGPGNLTPRDYGFALVRSALLRLRAVEAMLEACREPPIRRFAFGCRMLPITFDATPSISPLSRRCFCRRVAKYVGPPYRAQSPEADQRMARSLPSQMPLLAACPLRASLLCYATLARDS